MIRKLHKKTFLFLLMFTKFFIVLILVLQNMDLLLTHSVLFIASKLLRTNQLSYNGE